MFFKKKDIEDIFCIAVFPEKELTFDELDEYSDRFEEAGNIEVVSEVNLSEENIDILSKRFPETDISSPGFAVLKLDMDRIKEETKKMEQKYKWKKIFNSIPHDEYLIVETKTMFDFQYALFYTQDAQEVVTFLENQKKNS
ncbi:hypothetical protein F0342_05045 [Bacillus sp. CH30_1T]|uniref:hypothetical protein n=1 Tax=Bacillus sp. CH30_1T TaxID=2604836 RepID=UPI0011EC82E7|nr:hypothetical protein [Bacillus sp. CH30_1T]KAA0566054.1 hypothetical protein F0342_05045 [Bacillus sp. CH30_1T]